jgi:hypothetical protein
MRAEMLAGGCHTEMVPSLAPGNAARHDESLLILFDFIVPETT